MHKMRVRRNGYFFLDMYKDSLKEIRYFQNELTNVEAGYVALRVALDQDDKKLLGSIVDALGRTECNSLLKRGESAIDLERARQDATRVHSVTDLVERVASLAATAAAKATNATRGRSGPGHDESAGQGRSHPRRTRIDRR